MLTTNAAYVNAQQDFETYNDPYFGITLDRPTEWYVEGDNPWQHADITPWHLPLIPIKELQPTPVDILRDSTKTLIVVLEPGDDSTDSARVSVEKMPYGTTLDGYVQYSLDRIKKNNENVRIDETTRTVLDRNPAVKIVVTFGGSSGDDSSRTTQVLSLYGNLAYIFQYEGTTRDFGAHVDEYQRMVQSAKIEPPQSRAEMLSIPMVAIASALGATVALKVRNKNSYASQILRETKRLFPSSFGIEVLCVLSAEIGGFLGLYYFGFNPFGISMSYALAYATAGFTTFVSILGRHAHGDQEEMMICGCGDIEHDTSLGFVSGTKQTFVNFGAGLSRLRRLSNDSKSWRLVRASVLVLVSAESGCVIAAATIDLMFYQYSVFLSIPAALLAGTLTVALMAARKAIRRRKEALEKQ
jgi:hypothetical protein